MAESDEMGVLETSVDMTLQSADHEIDIFSGFQSAPVADAVDGLMYKIEHQPNPAGIELFARRLFSAVDAKRLREVSSKSPLLLAYVERMGGFYINYDRSAVPNDEACVIWQVESILNRILAVLEQVGLGLAPAESSPCEEACSIVDQRNLNAITKPVGSFVAKPIEPNPLGSPGSVPCVPGGEWDVRTRFAATCESLNLLVRLDYDMRCNMGDGTVLVKYLAPASDSMPSSVFDEASAAWRELAEAERKELARECAARMVLVLAAAAFTSGLMVLRCIVEQDNSAAGGADVAYEFSRDRFMAEDLLFTIKAPGTPLAEPAAADRLVPYVFTDPVPQINPPETAYAPQSDPRPLPEALVTLLRADVASELEVMEDPQDEDMRRFGSLRELARTDIQGSLKGLAALVAELEARQAAEEFMSDAPLRSVFCENHLGRILMPLIEEDPGVRFLRAPDALYFAQHEICMLLMHLHEYDRALIEARRLSDLAPTSMQAYCTLVSVLALAERFDEVIEACRKAFRVAYDRGAIAYLFYRLAFAFWKTGNVDAALACYSLVPAGEEMSDVAREELRNLKAITGHPAPESVGEAVATVAASGMPIPPTDAVAAHVADAAVLLADNGFFYLAGRCAYHMWRMSGRDEYGIVQKSLMPQW